MKKLKDLDFFGKKSELRFKQKTSFKTRLGAFVSWLLFTGGIGILAYFGRDLIIRESPQIISSERTASFSTFSRNINFQTAMALYNHSSQSYVQLDSLLFGESTLQSSIQAFIRLNYEDQKDPELYAQKLERCDPEKNSMIFENLDQLPFSRPSGLNDLLCLRLSTENIFSLQDRTRNVIGASLKVLLNASEGSGLSKALNNLQFVLLYQYVILDLNNYASPQTSGLNFYDTKLSSRTEKGLNLLLKSIVIESDTGLLIETKNSEVFLQLDVLQEKVNLLLDEQGSQNSLLQIDISLGSKVVVYLRKYVKLQEVLARVGGLLKILWLVTKFLMKPFIKLLYYQKLVNEIFNFYFDNNDKKAMLKTSATMNFMRKIRDSSKRMRRLSTSEVRQTLINKLKGMISKSSMKSKSQRLVEMTVVTKDHNLANININYAISPKKIDHIPESQSNSCQEILQNSGLEDASPPNQDKASGEHEEGLCKEIEFKTKRPVGICLNLSNLSNIQNSHQSQASPKNLTSSLKDCSLSPSHEPEIENPEGKRRNSESSKRRGSAEGHPPEEFYSPTTKKGMTSLFQVKSSPLNLNALEIGFYHMFNWGSLKKKKKLIKKGIKMIYEKLDIVYILNKLVELDKLKFLLFDRNQLKLFDYFPKPSLSPKDVSDNATGFPHQTWNSIFHSGEDIFQKARDAAHAFRELKSKAHPTKLDEKILEMIDPNIRRLLTERGASNSDINLNSKIGESGASFSQKRSRSQQEFPRFKEDYDISVDTNMENNSLRPGSLNLLERNLKSLKKREQSKKFHNTKEKESHY